MEEENSDQFSSDSNVSVLLGFTPVSTVYILVDLDVVVVDFQLLLLTQKYQILQLCLFSAPGLQIPKSKSVLVFSALHSTPVVQGE